MTPAELELLGFFAKLGLLLVGLFVVGLPLVRAVHLLGHGLAALALAGGASIRLGTTDGGRHFRAAGLDLRIAPFSGTVGYCEPQGDLRGWRRTVFDIAGPVASLAFAGVLTWLYGEVTSGTLLSLAVWGVWLPAVAQAILSIAPTVAPSWWPNDYAGATSDLHDYYPKRFF